MKNPIHLRERRAEWSLQRSRSAKREATSRGGGAPRHFMKSEAST